MYMNPNSKQKRIAFGYERLGNNKIVPHEGQAAALKLIYWMYAEGKSLAQIKDIMEGMNIPSPYNKQTWGKQAISNLLSNPHCLGSEIYPALITQELFDHVQGIKAQRTIS
jgi:hypothetical protein